MTNFLAKLKRHPLLVMGGYFLIYDLCFFMLEAWPRQYHVVYCGLDDLIPFAPVAVVPYVAWFVWVPGVLFFLLYRCRDLFWKTFSSIAAGTAVSLTLYALIPTAQNLRAPLTGTDPFTEMVRMIYRMDTPTNVCPSLHVFVSVVLLLALADAPAIGRRALFLHRALGGAICLSTVLINQHSIIDLVCGLALAVYLYGVIAHGRPLLPALSASRRASRAE